MSREDGFAVMDVSVDLVNDPKIRKLYRHSPDHAGAGFVAYVAMMGESWKAGQRVSIEDAWPAFLPFDPAAVAALEHVGLLDPKGLLSSKAWRSWFAPAQKRREAVRDRWRRANEKRAHSSVNDSGGTDDDAARLPRGDRAVTAANHSVPFRTDTVPLTTKEIPPPPAERGRRSNGTNLRATGESPRAKAANPRSNGSHPRGVRAEQKRGKTELGNVLRRAAALTTDPPDEQTDDQAAAERPRQPAAAGPFG